MEFPDCMVDIETTGLRPDHNQIIQIAAVKFNLEKGTISPSFFNRCLYPVPGRYWDEGTRIWWSSNEELLASLNAKMEPAEKVMRDFASWAGFDMNFWAKPISFDFPFVASYFNQFELTNPFNFRAAIDQNSFIRGRHFPLAPPKYEKTIEFDGTAHNAIDDVLHQIKVVSACYEATK